jgi:hypothetical protein
MAASPSNTPDTTLCRECLRRAPLSRSLAPDGAALVDDFGKALPPTRARRTTDYEEAIVTATSTSGFTLKNDARIRLLPSSRGAGTRGIYDNMKTAVEAACAEAQAGAALLALRR